MPHGVTDRRDLIVPRVHSAMFDPAFGRDPEARARRHDRFFERGHQRNDFAKAFELRNGVDDKLSGAVVGDVAAAFDFEVIHAARGEHLTRQQQVLALSIAARSHDGFVFDDEPGVALRSARDRIVKAQLQIPNLAVGASSQLQQSGPSFQSNSL